MNLSNPVLAILLYNASQFHLKVITLQNFYRVAHLYHIKTFVSSISASLKFNIVTRKSYLERKNLSLIRHRFLKIQHFTLQTSFSVEKPSFHLYLHLQNSTFRHANHLFNLKTFISYDTASLKFNISPCKPAFHRKHLRLVHLSNLKIQHCNTQKS